MSLVCPAAGAVDDLAMLPLLRQRVKNIIAAVAVHTGPDMSLEGFAAGEWVREVSE